MSHTHDTDTDDSTVPDHVDADAVRHHDQPDGLTRLAAIDGDHPSLGVFDPANAGSHLSSALARAEEALAQRAHRLGGLPAPGQRYTYQAVDDALARSDWQWLVHPETPVSLDDHGPAAEHPAFGGPADIPGRSRHSTRRVWATPPAVAATIIGVRRPADHPHPCLREGHRGVRNLGGGEYTCHDGDCDRRFDRETAAAILEADTA